MEMIPGRATVPAMRRRAVLLLLTALLGVQSTLAQSPGQPSDNTVAGARDMGTDPASFATREVVGSFDTADFYKFTLTSKRSVQISLTDISGDANLYLFGNGVWVASTGRGRVNEVIREDLDAGEYKVLVYGWAGAINHKITLKSWSPQPMTSITNNLPPLDGMNGRNPTVIAAGTIRPTTAYIDYVFNLPGRRVVSINGSGDAAAGVTPNTTPMRWQILQNNSLQNVTLPGGQYLLRVFRNPNAAESFSFRINARVVDTGDTAGHTRATARNLGRIGNPPTRVVEYVGQDDFDDYFRVNVNSNSVINVALTHNSGQNANVRVLDPGGIVIGSSTNAGDAPENISTTAIRGGVYWVHVAIATRTGPNWEDANYTMDVGTVPARVPRRPTPTSSGDAPGTFGQAAAFADASAGQIPGIGGAVITDGETVGTAADPADYFYFNIGCNSARSEPEFSVVSTGLVSVQLSENVNGIPPVSQGFTPITTQPANQRKNNYTYFLAVTPSVQTFSPLPYTLQVSHLGCT